VLPWVTRECIAEAQICTVSAECCQGGQADFCGEANGFTVCRVKQTGDQEPVYPEYAARGITHGDILPGGTYCGDTPGQEWDQASMANQTNIDVCRSKYSQEDNYQGRLIRRCEVRMVNADLRCRASADLLWAEWGGQSALTPPSPLPPPRPPPSPPLQLPPPARAIPAAAAAADPAPTGAALGVPRLWLPRASTAAARRGDGRVVRFNRGKRV